VLIHAAVGPTVTHALHCSLSLLALRVQTFWLYPDYFYAKGYRPTRTFSLLIRKQRKLLLGFLHIPVRFLYKASVCMM